MIAANYTKYRTDLKKYLDQVENKNETLIIKRGKGKDNNKKFCYLFPLR